ncbi:MAG TPA: diaminopimelate decarboxylase [Candidatus Limnocylindria bacterium]|jgi:diaminopimelate decarboxylase|nr:diaminopimelate decarboxylase [Candidatus Limnocylindria bacterium]
MIPSELAADKTIAGIPARELADVYGTPLFVIDLDELDLEIDRFLQACTPRGIVVGYAAKALLVTALAEHLAATPVRLDVCSLGELVTAERGGFPAGRMYFHGCGKTDEELRAIADRRVAFDVIDNREELERLAALASSDAPVDVMLRVNTGIEAHTHAFIRTGGENTKFGIALDQLPVLLARAAELPQLRLIGLHGHIGSQIAETAPFLANADELLRAAEQARALGHPIAELICGGGIGVEENVGDPRPLEIETLAEELAARVAGRYRVAIEPGRALIARAGTSLYRIMAIKNQGRRRFVVVDGGMADNPRPMLYGARHVPEVMSAAVLGPDEPATLAGRSCENDEMGDYVLPAGLAAGDLIAMHTTGAYTYSMASNYNRFGRPPVIFVRSGHHRRVVRGETAEEVARRDLL